MPAAPPSGSALLVRVGWVERVLTIEFGPSRSKQFRKAVEEAQSGAGECSELEPGRYRVRFVLGSDGSVYTSLARLLQRVRNWQATEVYEGDQLVSSYHARDIKIVDCSFRGPIAVGLGDGKISRPKAAPRNPAGCSSPPVESAPARYTPNPARPPATRTSRARSQHANARRFPARRRRG
jgi:hypothetical protein